MIAVRIQCFAHSAQGVCKCSTGHLLLYKQSWFTPQRRKASLIPRPVSVVLGMRLEGV